MKNNNFIKWKRLNALAIDFYIVSVVCAVPIIIITIILSFVLHEYDIFNLINYIAIIGTIFYIICLPFKDLIHRNASIGKTAMQLEIRDNENAVPSFLILILRNLFLLAWPIEILLVFIFNKRLGDIICKTKVVYKNR